MITPTVGRVVWYRPYGSKPEDQPCAAHVAYVHNDREINIMWIDHSGVPRPLRHVPLVQDGDQKPDGHYCEWMPYQKGQAAKTEALEKQVVQQA